MTLRTRFPALAVALLLTVGGVATACGGSSSSTATGATTASIADDLPEGVGSYGIGHTTVTVTDAATARPLTVDIWYPIAPGTTGTPTRYSFLPTAYIDSKVALADAPIATDGPFPLVVYSHGSGGQRYIASYLTEDIASHGYVVLAADHTGDTATDLLLGTAVSETQNQMNRPADVTAEINWALAQSASKGTLLSGAIDPGEIGLVGHSYGGYTVLADVGGHTTSLGTVTPDPRVKSVVAMAPYTQPLTDSDLAAIHVPVLLMVGTKDTITPLDPDSTRPFQFILGRPLVLLTMKDAAHQSFTDVCMYLGEIPKLPDAPALLVNYIQVQSSQGCGAGFMSYDRDIEISTRFTIGFLDETLSRPGSPQWFADRSVEVELHADDLTIAAKG
jgi:predicted dienelactone hydrolase